MPRTFDDVRGFLARADRVQAQNEIADGYLGEALAIIRDLLAGEVCEPASIDWNAPFELSAEERAENYRIIFGYNR